MEKWIKWKNSSEFTGQYEVMKIIQDGEGTTVHLESETNLLIVKFGYISILRCCDEGVRIKTIEREIFLNKDKKHFVNSFLFKVENSDFMNWVEDESLGLYSEKRNYTHYVIATANDVIDVVSSHEPEIIKKPLL